MISDFQNADDCGVYQISNDLLLVQTVDFFPPIVDDPFDFGEIAVANALSDVYAMGATPITAMSIVAFPEKKFKLDVLKKILKGGLKKLDEAKVALIGGHSVDDEELKYGLAVTGTVHPDKLFSNNTPREDDLLILTKPLGSGIVNTAVKAEFASENSVKVALSNMKQLNKYAFEIAKSYDLSAITDVTGFGFLGHLSEMIPCDKSIGFEIDFSKIKLLPNLKEYVNLGMVPSGTYDNRDFRAKEIFEMNKIPAEITDILFDPQTSGGLLFAVSSQHANKLNEELNSNKIDASIVGKVTNFNGKILIKNY